MGRPSQVLGLPMAYGELTLGLPPRQGRARGGGAAEMPTSTGPGVVHWGLAPAPVARSPQRREGCLFLAPLASSLSLVHR